MTRKTIFHAAVLALVLAGCRKNELPKVEDAGEPVFYAKCNINGIPINITAGLDEYVMNSSYYLDKNNLYVYKSELKQRNCTSNCGYEFTVLINNNNFADDPAATLDPDRSLTPGQYPFLTGTTDPLGWTCSFWPTNSIPNSSYNWIFSDGESMTGPLITRTLSANTKYSLAMYTNNSNCSSNFDNTFWVGDFLHTNINAENLGNLRYRFSATEGKNPPYRYRWDFGDNSYSTEATPEHTYNNQGQYTASLLLIDGKQDSCVWKYQVVPRNNCDANYMASFAPIHNTKALSAITLLLKDPSGKVYSSAETGQLQGNSFEIVSTSEYEINAQNQKTRKFKIRFNCEIKDGSNTLKISNGEAVLAAAYK